MCIQLRLQCADCTAEPCTAATTDADTANKQGVPLVGLVQQKRQ